MKNTGTVFSNLKVYKKQQIQIQIWYKLFNRTKMLENVFQIIVCKIIKTNKVGSFIHQNITRSMQHSWLYCFRPSSLTLKSSVALRNRVTSSKDDVSSFPSDMRSFDSSTACMQTT